MLDAPQPQTTGPTRPALQEPIALLNPPPPNRRRWVSRFRRPVVYLTFFLVIFALIHWLTPFQPSANINMAHETISSFCFSPDSSVIAVSTYRPEGDVSLTILMWDVAQNTVRYSVVAAHRQRDPVVFSPDGRYFAAYTKRGDIKLWKTQTGHEVTVIDTQNKESKEVDLVSFRFSPDSKLLVFDSSRKNGQNGDCYATFWNVVHGTELGTIKADFHTLAFAPDSETVATYQSEGNKTQVILWRMSCSRSPSLEKELEIPSNSIAISPDLKIIAALHSSPGKLPGIAFWDTANGAKRMEWSLTGGENLHYLSFDGNGRILIASPLLGHTTFSPNLTRVWNISGIPKKIGEYQSSIQPTVSPNGEWLSVRLLGGVELIKTSTGETWAKLVNEKDQRGRVSYAWGTFSPDEKTIVVSGLFLGGYRPFFADWLPPILNVFPVTSDFGVRLWDVESGHELAAFEKCYGLEFCPDGRYLATQHKGNVINLWRLPLPKPLWLILLWTVLVVAAGRALMWLRGCIRRARRRANETYPLCIPIRN